MGVKAKEWAPGDALLQYAASEVQCPSWGDQYDPCGSPGVDHVLVLNGTTELATRTAFIVHLDSARARYG